MRWQHYDEALDMQRLRYGYLPHVFRWRGQRYRVEVVDRSWTVSRRRRRRVVARRYFRVRSSGAVLDLYQDLVAGTWHLWRARFPAAAPRPVQEIVPVWR